MPWLRCCGKHMLGYRDAIPNVSYLPPEEYREAMDDLRNTYDLRHKIIADRITERDTEYLRLVDDLWKPKPVRTYPVAKATPSKKREESTAVYNPKGVVPMIFGSGFTYEFYRDQYVATGEYRFLEEMLEKVTDDLPY